MKKLFFYISIILFISCNSEEANDCLQVEGRSVIKEIELENFEEITVYGGIKLFLTYGETQEIRLETGENLVNDISFEVSENRLHLKNNNTCNFFREYDATRVYVTLPQLSYLRNGSQFTVESTNELPYSNLTLVSEDAEGNSDYYTNGDFQLQLNAEQITIVNNNLSDYFLSGQVENLQIGFYNGDGRFEGEQLIAQHINVYHRGSNKMIVNPQQSLTGTLYSTGDLIAKNHPTEVEVEELYTGSLIFE
tara:strand:- start:164 stop:913 length:750 start_codon:yes stop_codon:yes gene_type:complete